MSFFTESCKNIELTEGCQNIELTEGCQNIELTIDLSLIFDENEYINKSDCGKYVRNNSITHIILIQSNNSPIKIGDYFLYSYTNLISVDTSKIVNVIAIGNNFLFDCHKLTIFDTTGLTSLITIGHAFLSCCRKLTIFDATKLTSLTSIGNDFLHHCHNLTNFNTTGLISLTKINNYFLCDCNKNLIIVIQNPSDYLYNELLKTNYIITQWYNKPVIHLVNDCII